MHWSHGRADCVDKSSLPHKYIHFQSLRVLLAKTGCSLLVRRHAISHSFIIYIYIHIFDRTILADDGLTKLRPNSTSGVAVTVHGQILHGIASM